MAIQNRRGLKVDFDPNKMLPGEFAYALDTAELYYCYGTGNVKKLATVDDLQLLLDTNEETHTALQQLISELEEETVLTGLLADISGLQDNKLDKDGVSSNNTVIFTETDEDVDIASGENHTTLFGKILKSIKTIRTAFSSHQADNTSAHGINLKANKALGSVVSLSLQNGWGGGVDVRKNDLGQVTLSGTVSIGTATTGTIIATLPAGYNPIAARVVIQAHSSTTGKSDNYLIINDTNEIELKALNATGWLGFHIIYQGVV